MDETQIQQFVKWFIKLFIVLLLLAGVSSCVQLRYTDYGKPFDFLKSKNQHFSKSNSVNDTASTYLSNIPEKSLIVDNSLSPILDSISAVVEQPSSIKQINTQNAYCNEKDIIKERPIVSNLIAKNRLASHIQPKNINANDYSKVRGPGWWDKFWKGFWNFVLKWLLIFLCIFIVLALLVWGIYMLITVLLGPMAAAIFLVIVLTLFYILFEFG